MKRQSETKTETKVEDLTELAVRLNTLKGAGKKIVQCHGIFDLLHVGHIRHLEEAKAMGDVLVVTITPDQYVNKGPHRPAFSQDLRAEVIANLGMVDYVAINCWPTAVEAIQLLRPNIYVKGPDYKDASKDITQGIQREEEAVRSVGGEIRFTENITFSSSGLVNRYLPLFPAEVNGYLNDFRQRHAAGDIFQYLNSLRDLKVMIVGETILDEYVYCDALNRSGKEPVLAMRYLACESYPGGILAIANHLANFCASVQLMTYLGATNPREESVRTHLKPNVTPTFICKSESPTIVKRRYVDHYTLSKLFAVYEFNDEVLTEQEENELCATLEAHLPQCDLVIVADFGHGLITPRAAQLLSDKARFLAVNTQLNAANIGFHTISKYKRADYVCIKEVEIRLDSRSRNEDLRKLTLDLSKRLSCKTVMVTRGSHGTLLYQDGEGFFDCPAFAVKVMDRVGAGDAVLALTSLCIARNVPPDVISFIANLVGAQVVAIVGNSSSIERVGLLKAVESFLK